MGQTLAELDLDFLASRLGERGHRVEPAVLERVLPAAWDHYEREVRRGASHPWKELMTSLLERAGVADIAALVDWLWAEQPAKNLWRRPIAPMVAIVRELADRGALVGVVSNSEGRLAELLADIGIAPLFASIVDSGKLGIAKPEPGIFTHALAELAAPADALPIHIGDLWSADVVGARGVGWRAIWYGPHAAPVDDAEVAAARDASEVRAALVRWGAL